MNNLLSKLGISVGASLLVTEAVNLEPLWTALITIAVSIITVLTVEGVAWLKSWLKSKTAKSEAEQKKFAKQCEEADEQCEIAKSLKDKED